MSLHPPVVMINSTSEKQPLLSAPAGGPGLKKKGGLGALDLIPDMPPLSFAHRLMSRLMLHHVVDNRPGWHLFRIFAGAAGVMAINKAVGCTDDLSAAFTFLLCVSAFSGSTLLAVREVLVGGLVGAAFGLVFCIFTHLVSETAFYAYSWQVIWTVPLAMVFLFYLLSVLGATGPDKLQLLSAETSAVLLITVPFAFPPIAKLEIGEWSILVESLVTRAISLVNGCIMGLISRVLGKVFTWVYGQFQSWRRGVLTNSEEETASVLESFRHASSAPTLSPRNRRKLLEANKSGKMASASFVSETGSSLDRLYFSRTASLRSV
jgi:hypothetical protein